MKNEYPRALRRSAMLINANDDSKPLTVRQRKRLHRAQRASDRLHNQTPIVDRAIARITGVTKKKQKENRNG